MELFFDKFFGFMRDFLYMLHSYKMYVFGVHISLFEILLGFLLTSLVISVFWKGARG